MHVHFCAFLFGLCGFLCITVCSTQLLPPTPQWPSNHFVATWLLGKPVTCPLMHKPKPLHLSFGRVIKGVESQKEHTPGESYSESLPPPSPSLEVPCTHGDPKASGPVLQHYIPCVTSFVVETGNQLAFHNPTACNRGFTHPSGHVVPEGGGCVVTNFICNIGNPHFRLSFFVDNVVAGKGQAHC